MLSGPKGTLLPRTKLVFRLSGPQVQQNLIQEFSLHHDVIATGDDIDGVPLIRVETANAAGPIWDVRATVGMFDDHATEIKDDT